MKGGGYHYSLIKTFHLQLINLQFRDNACMNKARRVLKEHGSQIYRHFYGGHCKLRTIPIFMLFFYDLNSTKQLDLARILKMFSIMPLIFLKSGSFMNKQGTSIGIRVQLISPFNCNYDQASVLNLCCFRICIKQTTIWFRDRQMIFLIVLNFL